MSLSSGKRRFAPPPVDPAPIAPSPRRKPRRAERGVALLLVLVGLAVLALLCQETRYNSIVELRLATNARDEMRAHYLAKSGIGLSRMLLRFQKQMDQIQIPNLAGLLGGLGGGAGGLAGLLGGGAGGLPGAAGSTPAPQTMSIQLWRMAKIDCHMLAQMVPEIDPKAPKAPKVSGLAPKEKKFDFDTENPELAKKMAARKFGGFDGCFDTIISDEEERINLNKLDQTAFAAQVIYGQLTTAFTDKKYEFLFDSQDSNKVKVTPQELIVSLRDWVDDDEVSTTLNLTGVGDPFAKGFSDENFQYDKYDPRYRAKNARFDSLDELYMVHGVNDKVMAAFKDRFTVYPDINSKMNINTDDPVLLELAIRSIADPARPDPRLLDPIFIDSIIKKIRTARVFALFGMSATDFVNIIASAGVATNPTITNNVQRQQFIGDKSSTYRLKVTGSAGDVTRTITAVVRLDDTLGRLVYWRED